MNQVPFQNGALVRLRSGGPAMTVDNERDDLTTVCWFDDAGVLHKEAFAHQCLEAVTGSAE